MIQARFLFLTVSLLLAKAVCAAICNEFPDAGPVNSGQNNTYPCDTSFIRSQFNCSETGDAPCMSGNVKPWASGYLAPKATPDDEWGKAPFVFTTNYSFAVILTITDTLEQAEHFLVKVNDKFVGESGRETGYSNVNYNGNNYNAALANKAYTRGFYMIPSGTFKVLIKTRHVLTC